ncbi:MAG TPA: peptidyl-prolyl cis-trans isomerase [Candidatus Acidoferrales bacterium]|nr:peptidyl-prolyl cis-trans isomerase [Candidatus Acidoferrales bacterium]
MWDALREKKIGVRIMLGIVVGILGIGMLLYLVPQGTNDLNGSDAVAQVGGQTISVVDVQNQLSKSTRGSQIPPALISIYTQQALDQLIEEKMLALEAARMGLRVSDEEHADLLKKLVPTAFTGDTFIGMDRYTAEVQSRFQMSVPEFETEVKNALLQQKFQQLVTDGVTASDDEVREEFRRENEKIKLDYVLIKPEDLQSKVEVSDADLAAYFDKNKPQYVVPERRTVDYAVLDLAQLRQRAPVTEDDEKVYYQKNIDQYKLEDRAHVAHILFKTVGMTDAEAAEVKKKAEDVLNKAKHGGNFADLAKQYSEDTTKDKGGDLGWIVRGQTVPEFEAVAFSLPKGSISDLVKTQYGFHIIEVVDRETARTQTLDEVKASIVTQLQQQKAEELGETISTQIADEIRRSGRIAIEDLAKKFNMTIGQAKLVEANQPLPELGNAPGLIDTIFHQRVGDVSAPVHTDLGYVVVSVKDIQSSHPATLAEVRDRVATDYRHEQAVELAKSRAQELAKRTQSGENFAAVAKALGFDVKTSEPISRAASIPDVGSAKQFAAAFTLPVGQTGDPLPLGQNWALYRVAQHDPVNQDDFEKQKAKIEEQVVQRKRQTAYDLFRTALKARLQQEGQLHFNAENLKRLVNPA